MSGACPPHHELNEIDWKLELSTDKSGLAEHLYAFANHPGGGFFAFGIDAGGSTVGVDASKIGQIMNQLANLGWDAVEPRTAIVCFCNGSESRQGGIRHGTQKLGTETACVAATYTDSTRMLVHPLHLLRSYDAEAMQAVPVIQGYGNVQR
jgi:hypothetical protein